MSTDWSPERILDFKARLPRPQGWSFDRRQLLWPVEAWQVVVPRPERAIDILQRAVLRLIGAGVRVPDRLAGTLALDSDLIALLLVDLHRLGLITPQLAITEAGERMLDDATPSLDGVMTGWVFRDTWTGELLPRFTTDWPMADLQFEGQRPCLSRGGTRGQPLRAWPLFVLPRGDRSERPSQRDVLNAARRHERQHRARRGRADGDELDDEASVGTTSLTTAATVSASPVRCHLVTFVAWYDSEAIERGAPAWSIADPFGFGHSETMRATFLERMVPSDGKVRTFYEAMAGKQLAQLENQHREVRELVRESADLILRNHLPGHAFPDVPGVMERLRFALTEREVVRNFSDSGAAPSTADAIWLALRQSLEAAIDALRHDHLPRDTAHLLRHDDAPISTALARDLLRAAGQNVGFTGKNLPKAVSNTSPRDLERMCTAGSSANLRPLCAALLLAASRSEQHPLRAVAAEHPRWLLDVDEVATHAGARVHNQGQSMSLGRLDEDIDRTLRALAALNRHR